MPSSCWKLTEDKRLTIVVFDVTFLFLGVLGNIAVIIYNIFLNRDKTPNSWLVTFLGLADLLVCLTFYPASVVKYMNKLDNNPGLETIHYKATHSTVYVSLFLSIMFLLTITIEKYLYIAKPLKYPMIITKRRTFILASFIRVTALAQIPIVYIGMKKKVQKNGKPCHYQDFVLYLYIVQLVPICIITFLNYKIFKIVKEQKRRIAMIRPSHAHSEQTQTEHIKQTWLPRLAIELKAVRTFAIIVGVLICCFVPHIVIIIMVRISTCYCSIPIIARIVVKELVGINSVVNAYIYALRHKKYTRAYKQLFLSVRARVFKQNN